jgi:teichuronic acid biosynthesis glycosyltransferase TuaC
MKILILSHLYPSKFQPVYGTFVHEQVKELIEQGCEVKVVSPIKAAPFPINKLSEKWREFSDTPKKDQKDGVSVYHPRYLSLPKNILFEQNGNFMYNGIKQTVEEIRKDFHFDLIHAHVALPDGFAAHRLSNDFNVPFIVTIHGGDFFKSIFHNEKTKSNIKQTIEGAEKVILVSERLKRILHEQLHNSTGHVKVIHNGISDFFLRKRKASKQYFSEGNIKLLSVCRLVEGKGIAYNLKALSKTLKSNPNIQYIIAGDGSEREYLERLAKDLGIAKNVSFLGAVQPSVVKELMDECDIFSLPAWNEAFGVVYIEAMASSAAVIGCLGEGAEEIIEPEIDGMLVPPRDEEALAKVFSLLIKDPSMRENISNCAKKTVEKRFTLKRNVSKIIDVYQEVLSESR